MKSAPGVVAKFRREHAAAMHSLLPYALAYSAALAEGDAASCEAALDCLAQILVDDFRLPRAKRTADVPSAGGNVTPLKRTP